MVSFTLRPLYLQPQLYRMLGCPRADALRKTLHSQNAIPIVQASIPFLVVILLRLLEVQNSGPKGFEGTAVGLRKY